MEARCWAIFLEVFEALPRQGPGNRASTERALALCGPLPAGARAVDLGCGVGAQTLDLVERTDARIVALDLHVPNVRRLERTVREHGLGRRVLPVVADLGRPPLAAGGLDLVWSEGALYNVGLATALARCAELLRRGGALAFTEAVWRAPDPPAEVRASFADYPTMGGVADVLEQVAAAGLTVAGHFPLPEEAWWDDFYGPLERTVEQLRRSYANDPEALACLDEVASEAELRRRFAASYGYEFVVAHKPLE